MTASIPSSPRSVARRLAATLAAAATALALTGAAALPARAGSDTGKIVAGLAAVAIAGAILHEAKGPGTPLAVQYRDRHDRYGPPRHHGRAPVLPQSCAFEARGARSPVVYSERCLRRAGFDYRLPRHCAQEVRVSGRPDRVYGERCLVQAGFRTDGRRFDNRFDHRRYY